jgi:hypothetical protein
LYFELLQSRLLQTLRSRLRNGELTERSLARLTGISQPHVHNVLKGARILSPEIADQILKTLGLSIFDLIEPDEFEAALAARHSLRSFARVPLLTGLVGPGHPWPAAVATNESYWVCGAEARRAESFTAVRLAPDLQIKLAAGGGRVALLDTSDAARSPADPNAYYAVASSGGSFIRRIKPVNKSLFLITDLDSNREEDWVCLPFSSAASEIIRGKVLMVVPAESDPAVPQILRFPGLEISR